MKITKNTIYRIDIAVIVITLIALGIAVGYARPLLLAPFDDAETSNNSVLFSFEKGKVILIDDNIEFSSPEEIYAQDNLVINLKPGTYYWKVSGLFESEIRKLTVLSRLDLKIRDSGDNYELVNSGNKGLNVSVYDNETFVNSLILGADESENVSGTKFIGRENEK